MATAIVVLNDHETYTAIDGCQLVMLLCNEDEILAEMNAGSDLTVLDDYEEGTDFRSFDLAKIVSDYLDRMARLDGEDAVAEGQEDSCPPTKEVSWKQVAAAVPEEAAAFEAALALAEDGIDLDVFFLRYDDDLPEEVRAAWERVTGQFHQATGLQLWPYRRYLNEDDDETGFEVIGAWELSAAGRRFFGNAVSGAR
jgi:hypothetical protein